MMNDVTGNAAEFVKSLNAIADYATKNVEKVIRKSCLDLYREVVRRCPRDTGRAAASWGISTGSTKLSTEPPEGGWPKDIRDSMIGQFAGKEMDGFSFGISDNQVIIYNNIEYIEQLENGTSTQAPVGFVALSLADFSNHFNKELAKFEGLEPA